MAKRKTKCKLKPLVRLPDPLNRCPDCNARPEGSDIYHENSCPHYHALVARQEADERWFVDHPGEMFLERPICAAELSELQWIAPEAVDSEEMPDTGAVGIANGQRVRGFTRRSASTVIPDGGA